MAYFATNGGGSSATLRSAHRQSRPNTSSNSSTIATCVQSSRRRAARFPELRRRKLPELRKAARPLEASLDLVLRVFSTSSSSSACCGSSVKRPSTRLDLGSVVTSAASTASSTAASSLAAGVSAAVAASFSPSAAASASASAAASAVAGASSSSIGSSSSPGVSSAPATRAASSLSSAVAAPGSEHSKASVTSSSSSSSSSVSRSARPDLSLSVSSSASPGMRKVKVEGLEFFAFTFPRKSTQHIAIWRRIGSAASPKYASIAAEEEISLGVVSDIDSLSPGRVGMTREGPWADLYRRKAFDQSTWVYWESFWAPVWPSGASPLAPLPVSTFPPLELFATLGEASQRGEASGGGGGGGGGGQPQNAWMPEPASAGEKSAAFTRIYEKFVWPGLLSRSGPGSDPFHPIVRVALTALDLVVDALDVESMLDAACGDAAWITELFLARRPGLNYTGIDIVPHVVEENRQKWPHLGFLCADLGSGADTGAGAGANASGSACEVSLPMVDLVFSKETFNHMIVSDAARAIRRLVETGSRYLLTNITRGSPNYMGSEKGHHANYAQYDYGLPPFSLTKVAKVMDISKDDWTEFALFRLK